MCASNPTECRLWISPPKITVRMLGAPVFQEPVRESCNNTKLLISNPAQDLSGEQSRCPRANDDLVIVAYNLRAILGDADLLDDEGDACGLAVGIT